MTLTKKEWLEILKQFDDNDEIEFYTPCLDANGAPSTQIVKICGVDKK